MTNSGKKATQKNGGGPPILEPPTAKSPTTSQLAELKNNRTEFKNLKPMEVVAEFKKLPKEKQKEYIGQVWFLRTLIVGGKLQKKNENQTMKWIREVTKKNNLVEIDEIRYCFVRLVKGKELDFVTPWSELKKREDPHILRTLMDALGAAMENTVQISEQDGESFVETLHKMLQGLDVKKVQELEVSRLDTRKPALFKVTIKGKTHLFYYSKKMTLLNDVLSFLEICHKENVKIKTLTVAFKKHEEFFEFLSKFLENEIVGKVDVEAVTVLCRGAPVKDGLQIAKYVKCKRLDMSWFGFGYGEAREFVKAMRRCHPGLEECTISSHEEIPHYLNFWTRFDHFDVTSELKILKFKKSNREVVIHEDDDDLF